MHCKANPLRKNVGMVGGWQAPRVHCKDLRVQSPWTPNILTSFERLTTPEDVALTLHYTLCPRQRSNLKIGDLIGTILPVLSITQPDEALSSFLGTRIFRLHPTLRSFPMPGRSLKLPIYSVPNRDAIQAKGLATPYSAQRSPIFMIQLSP